MDAYEVEVEVDLSRGHPAFTGVGLPDAAAVAGDLPVLAAETLPQVAGYLNEELELARVQVDPQSSFDGTSWDRNRRSRT
jgi:hypothetical protein